MEEGLPFDLESRARISRTLTWWAWVHPRRDLPVLEAADGSQLTPRTIAAAVGDPESPTGRPIYELFEHGLADEERGPKGLDEMLAVFVVDAERWARDGRHGHGRGFPPEGGDL